MNTNMHETAPNEEPVIEMTRTFNAPREVVWAVFTDPKHVAKWYGGHGFSSPRCEMDVRPGGLWRHTMRAPDGTELAFDMVFLEIVRPEKVVWENVGHGEHRETAHPTCRNTVTFAEAGPRKTAWRLEARFHSIAARDLAMKSGFTAMVWQGSEKLDAIASAVAAGQPS